jgi:hypothetical protein
MTKTLTYNFCDDNHLNAVAKKSLLTTFARSNAHESLCLIAESDTKHMGQNRERSLRLQFLSNTLKQQNQKVHDTEREIPRYDVRHHPELKKRLAEEESEAAATRAELEAVNKAPRSANLPVETAIEWMGEQKGEFRNAPPVKVTAPRGFFEAVKESRAKLGDLKSQKSKIAKVLLPESVAVARLLGDVQKMALPLDVAPTTRMHRQLRNVAHSPMEYPDAQGSVRFPVRKEYFGDGRSGELDEAFRFLCWLLPEQIIAKGKAEIAAIYKQHGPGLSVEERTKLIAEIDVARLQEERREETLIRAATANGETIWRRPDMSIEAALGVMRV